MKKQIIKGSLVAVSLIAIIISGKYISTTEDFKSFRNEAAAVLGRGVLTIYDGGTASLPQGTADHPCLTNGQEVSPGKEGTGNALKLMPDAYHAPGYSVNCGGQDRLDFSPYSYLEFYIKSDTAITGSKDFNIVSYYGTSNTVNILNYIQGGTIDGTWRLVSIPLSDLKTSTYNLNTVDTLYFGTDPQSRVFYVDTISVRISQTQTAPAVQPTAVVAVAPSRIKLYDGEQGSAPLLSAGSPCIGYAEEFSGVGMSGSTGLRLKPDPYHSPDFKVYCGGRDRLDLSGYAAIEFYLKGDTAASNDAQFNVVSYYGTSNTVSIKKYIEGGVIDTNYRLVSIPIADLKNANYNLSTVDDFYFGTDSKSRLLFLDNLAVTKNKSYVNSTVVNATQPSIAPVTTSKPVTFQSSATPRLTPTPTPIAVVVKPLPIPVPVIAKPVPLPPIEIPFKPQPRLAAQNTAATADELYDFDEVDLANNYGQWLYTDNADYVSLNFVQKYNVGAVTNLSNYSISSEDDAAYSAGKKPVSLGYDWHTIYVPTIRKTDLKVAYRVYLHLPSSFVNGKTYTVTATNLGITTKPFTFVFDDSRLNNDIRVNQVGYLPDAKKLGYVGQYMGTAGPMPFDISSFEVKDATTDAVVYRGVPHLRNVDTNNTGENVYELDFSALNKAGSYYIHVPDVGISYSFRIGSDIYNEVLSTALHGAYQQRSGTSLTAEYTRFTHGPAHVNDAYVMNENPIPDWFRARFDSEGDTHLKDASGKRLYYPTTLSGQYVSTVKGHYDAGDYGKYVINGSLFVGNILAAYDAFPERLMKDDLHVPESGNGIPDLIDETKWELDWLENMQDPNDGGVFCILKPDGAVEYYENRAMDALSPSKRLLYPKDTTCTGAYAAAMAKAGRSPLIKKYYPDAAARYITKAEKAWEFLAKTPGYLGWHHYGLKDEYDTDKSMDERVWASIELFGATGKKDYMDFFLAHANPEYERWGWNTLFEASGQADYACAFMTKSGMDAAMKARCVKEIIKAADSHVQDSNDRAYRLSMSDAPLNYRDYTYFFPQERIIQLLIANSLKSNPAYTQTALYNWDYILGDNPTSYSYITGIGSKRFRDVVSTQSVYDDIKPPVPGLPVGMGNNFGYLEVYGSSLAQMFPVNNGGSPDPKVSYPLLKQVYDGWNIGVEYTIPELSENIVSAAYFATQKDSANQPPSQINISASPASGPSPLRVAFNAMASDPDGKIVRYFWDFDDESYSVQQNPTHVFKDPYKLYKVVLTVTDNDGAEKYKEIDVRTSPPVFDFTSSNYTADANTVALFHFDQSLGDAAGNNYAFKLSGGTRMTSENILWMKAGTGQALAFNSVDDTASVEIPSKKIMADSGASFTAEAKIFVDSFLSLNVKSSNIFTLTQGDDKAIGLYDAIYVDGTHVTSMAGYDKQKIILSSKDIAALMKQGTMQLGTWYNLKFVVGGGKASVYINDDKIAESDIAPDFSQSDAPVKITVGGFKGYLDEIRIAKQ